MLVGMHGITDALPKQSVSIEVSSLYCFVGFVGVGYNAIIPVLVSPLFFVLFVVVWTLFLINIILQ